MTQNEIKELVRPKYQTLSDAATIAFDYSLGQVGEVTISTTRDIAFTNLKTPSLCLLIVNHGAGLSQVNLPGDLTWDSAWATGVGETTICAGIYNGTKWRWELNTAAAAVAGATLEDIVYSPNTGLSAASTTWSGSTANGGGNWTGSHGVATKKIAASTDGYYQITFTASDTEPIIGFKTANTDTDYTGFLAGLCGTGGTLYYNESGGTLVSTGISYATGDLVRLRRTGSTITAEKSTDGGTTWPTTVRTYSVTSSADLFLGAVTKNNSTQNKIYAPKGYNLI